MKNLFVLCLLIVAVMVFSTASFAEEKKEAGWEQEFIESLQKGKMPIMGAGGLPYTPSEDVVLEDAIKKAMEKEAPPCQCMTIAMELEYNPYMVMKNIYTFQGELDLDQLCICATQKGVDKQIIAKAAMDAKRNGEPAFQLDEVTSSNCLKSDQGLAYTLGDEPPPIIPPPPVPPPASRSVP